MYSALNSGLSPEKKSIKPEPILLGFDQSPAVEEEGEYSALAHFSGVHCAQVQELKD